MGNLLSERLKVDTQLVSQALNGASTPIYYNMKKYRKALLVVEIGAMAAAATCAMAAWEARDDAATGAQALAAITATMTANTGVAEATLTLVTVLVGDTVTVNGLVYTAAAAADLPNRVFDQSGADAADAASLVLALNHVTAGVPGVLAVDAGGGVINLVATELGEMNITATSVGGTITIATIRAVGYLEVDHTMLTKATALVAAYTHIGFVITNSAGMQTGAVVLRGNNRYTPTQYVAAADTA